MASIVISPSNVVTFPEGGGHFWVYMQYVQALRQAGCDVYWLERFESCGDQARDDLMLKTFLDRMERYDLGGKTILYESRESQNGSPPIEYIASSASGAEEVLRQADLLLNFHYTIHPHLLSKFRRTALMDIDPGLLQFWMSTGQLDVAEHDAYFTIGETVGTPTALFPDCGLPWSHIRPPVCLDLWPCVSDPAGKAFTTVSSWWGLEFVADGEAYYDNNKRASFLKFLGLPSRTDQALELAIFFGEEDAEDLRTLKHSGWDIRHCKEVAGTPESYQTYIQLSRGEFSCVKPSCVKFQNAWISDRTLCYLASGRPVVVQHTGPSSFLPNGEGMFRFVTMADAVDALAAINANYEKHCRAAREIAEAYFDAEQIVEAILNQAL